MKYFEYRNKILQLLAQKNVQYPGQSKNLQHGWIWYKSKVKLISDDHDHATDVLECYGSDTEGKYVEDDNG